MTHSNVPNLGEPPDALLERPVGPRDIQRMGLTHVIIAQTLRDGEHEDSTHEPMECHM